MYEKGKNLIQYLKGGDISKKTTDEMVMVSYDLQNGSYIQNVKNSPEFNEKYTRAIAKIINELDIKYDSILEVGVGEATTLANLIPKLKIEPKRIYGFDLAWSRVRYAVEYMKKRGMKHIFFHSRSF